MLSGPPRAGFNLHFTHHRPRIFVVPQCNEPGVPEVEDLRFILHLFVDWRVQLAKIDQVVNDVLAAHQIDDPDLLSWYPVCQNGDEKTSAA